MRMVRYFREPLALFLLAEAKLIGYLTDLLVVYIH